MLDQMLTSLHITNEAYNSIGLQNEVTFHINLSGSSKIWKHSAERVDRNTVCKC